MRLGRFDLALGLGLSWALGCGSRTELGQGAPPPGAPIACEVDSECDSGDLCHPGECFEGFCQYAAPIECDDSDPCTEDSCSPVDGQCVFEPLTVDLDGDGFRGPRPGYAPGAPDSCGDDCDDTSALAYPGGVEYCDGLDNDCNGVRDDGAASRASRFASRIPTTAQ